MNVPEGFKTTADAAKELGVSTNLIKRRSEDGEFKLYRNPTDHRQRLIKIDELEAWLKRERPDWK